MRKCSKIKNIISQFKIDTPIECVYDKDNELNDFCDVCHSIVQINQDNFMTCSNIQCGKLFTNILNNSAEWRYFSGSDTQNPARCGMPINPLLQESSYGCSINCSRNRSYEMKKIKRYTEWQSMPYKEKARYDEFEKIKALAKQAGVPKIIIDTALNTHFMISGEKTFRGLNRDGVIAASIYISFRLNNFPRTAKELSHIFNLDTTSATKGCKNAMFILNKLEKNMDYSDKSNFKKTEPKDFIDRYCSRLSINHEMVKLAKFICIKIQNDNLIPENTPHSIAAGVIYFISDLCRNNITKQDINIASNISEVTINKCFKRINDIRYTIVPPSLLNKYKR
jgi:transcription initiation factor TFIIB